MFEDLLAGLDPQTVKLIKMALLGYVGHLFVSGKLSPQVLFDYFKPKPVPAPAPSPEPGPTPAPAPSTPDQPVINALKELLPVILPVVVKLLESKLSEVKQSEQK